jgi:S-adenosylmethionine:tRNA ribosyltransferase-isomerase
MRATDVRDRDAVTDLASVTPLAARRTGGHPAGQQGVRGPALSHARSFRIPDGAEAGTPVEIAHGDGRVGSEHRADVRLMVARRATGGVEHRRFPAMGAALDPGDVLVVNTSAVIPAALDAVGADGRELRLHLSTEQPGGFWVVEPRRHAGVGTVRHDDDPPRRLDLAGGGRATLLTPYPADATARRLWLARLDLGVETHRYLADHGHPIRYAHIDGAWPLAAYQSVFSRVPGSAEMPSAARPFTDAIVTDLVTRGVVVAPITLHTGVSSQEAGEPPYAERYSVPPATASLVDAAHAEGRRVIAVGTTVVRALETTADDRGRSHPGSGWTETVVTPERGVRVVDGLLTGWHEPESSHLAMLEAIAGRPLLEASYEQAVAERYRWHEFGDSHLILP